MIKNLTIALLLVACGALTYFLVEPQKPYLLISADAVLPDGGKYTGSIVDNQFHGKGTIVWKNGDRLSGQFQNGLLNGEGEFVSTGGSSYRGEFVDGLFEGEGVYHYIDGSIYTGAFKNDYPHGNGKLVYKSGDHYEGEFVKSRFWGEGEYHQENGVYRGTFENDEIVSGTYTDVNSNVYEGEFSNWFYNGQGTYTASTGEVYKGTFVDGFLSGQGSYSSEDGTHYQGGFDQSYYSGQGKLVLENGDVYEGEFNYGQYHGEGELTLSEPVEGVRKLSGTWQWGQLEDDPRNQSAIDYAENVEKALYSQDELLQQAAENIAAGQLGETELFFLGFSSYSDQSVFVKEIETVKNLFNQEDYAKNRSLTLVNSHQTIDTTPLATEQALKYALSAMENKMNVDEDILFLYFSSHGSDTHELSVQMNGIDLPELSAQSMADIVNQSSIKSKVIVISACYSGGFIPLLANDNHLVISAARDDRRSFGCSDDFDMTYFARAYFENGLSENRDFIEAFYEAQTVVEEWENSDFPDDDHSLPQISVGEQIESKIKGFKLAESVIP